MAPIPWMDDLARMAASHRSSPGLRVRHLSRQSLTATIVVLAIVSALLLISMMFLLARIRRQLIARGIASRSSLVPDGLGSMTERKTSDWARQDSNVLWAMYIEEDDLKSQFATPSKSRLFSIGSLASDDGRCPLDRRDSVASEVGTPQVIVEGAAGPGDDGELRSRATYEQDTTPNATPPRVRARSQPFHHRKSNSLDAMAPRKQSEPVNRIKQPAVDG